MAIRDMAAERAERNALKQQAVTALRDWIRAKAAAAGVGNTVDWGVLKFKVSRAAAAPTFSGVYDSYPITATFPNNVDTLSTPAPVAKSGDTTAGSASISNIGDTSTLKVGMLVTGTGIPAGALVQSIDSATTVTLTAEATATATGVSLTFTTIWATLEGDNVQETLRRDGFDRGTRVDIAIAEDNEISYTIFVVDQELLARDIVDTNSRELSRIMRKKILYAKVDVILDYVAASEVPDKFPGFVF